MKSFALALTFGAVSALHQQELKYMNFLAKFGKTMNDVEEFETRLEHFISTDSYIEEVNAEGKSWTAGHNQFSDWSPEEYKSMLGYIKSDEELELAVFDEAENQETVNWVDRGAVTGVKNQGSCGSCWSFSSTGAMEGAHWKATYQLESFSEQQLVDCSTYGNMGCNGGNPYYAYQYYQSNPAILETTYPYTSAQGQQTGNCYSQYYSNSGVRVQTSRQVSSSSSQVMAALNQQPLSVIIEADQRSFQTYKTGVLTTAECGTNLDHAVLAVGYGSENGMNYWLVKNSWGTWWGDQGYIKLQMDNTQGACGVQLGASYPTTN